MRSGELGCGVWVGGGECAVDSEWQEWRLTKPIALRVFIVAMVRANGRR